MRRKPDGPRATVKTRMELKLKSTCSSSPAVVLHATGGILGAYALTCVAFYRDAQNAPHLRARSSALVLQANSYGGSQPHHLHRPSISKLLIAAFLLSACSSVKGRVRPSSRTHTQPRTPRSIRLRRGWRSAGGNWPHNTRIRRTRARHRGGLGIATERRMWRTTSTLTVRWRPTRRRNGFSRQARTSMPIPSYTTYTQNSGIACCSPLCRHPNISPSPTTILETTPSLNTPFPPPASSLRWFRNMARSPYLLTNRPSTHPHSRYRSHRRMLLRWITLRSNV